MLLLALIVLTGLVSAGSQPGIDWRGNIRDGFDWFDRPQIEFCFTDARHA
jgi:hypothetical protein